MNTDSNAFSAVHFRLLGGYYQRDFALEVEADSDGGLVIQPPRSTWKRALTRAAFLGLAYVGFIWFASATDKGEAVTKLYWGRLAVFGVVLVIGPVAFASIRVHYLRRKSPLVAYSSSNGTISILNGRHVFPVSDVYALVGLSLADFGSSNIEADRKSELQLVVWKSGELVPHLIIADLSESAKQCYGNVLSEFENSTGIRTMVLEPNSSGRLTRLDA